MRRRTTSKNPSNLIPQILYPTLPWFGLTVLGSLVGGLLVIPQTFLFAKLITGIPTHLNHELPLLKSWWMLGAVILGRGIYRYIAEIGGVNLSIRVKTRLRETLLNHVLQSGQSQLQQEQVGEWIQTVYADVENIEPLFREAIPQMIIATVIPCSILIIVWWTDWISGLILLVTAPLIPFFMILLGHLAKSRTTRRWEAMRQLGGHFYDIVSGLTTLKLFHRSGAQANVIAKVGEAYRKATMDTLKVAFLSSFAMELLATLGTAMVAVGVGLRLVNGNLTFVDGLATIILAGEFYLPLRNLGSQFHASMEGRVALQHIASIVQSPLCTPQRTTASPSFSESGAPYSSAQSHTTPFEGTAVVHLDNVTYAYPISTDPVLTQVSCSVYEGERVAVIGSSGSGKSTLFSLLVGSIQPQTGTVYVHGQPLSKQTSATWRRSVAFVGQHPHIFSGSIFENLKIANPTAAISEIHRVAEQAGVAVFAQQLRYGYKTQIGSGGISLSAGQIQRIALARALLKSCDVWLLDEPTAHLDVESERWFAEVLNRLPLTQTIITITHRLSTLERMNKVFLMRDGRLTTVTSPEDGWSRTQWFEHLHLESMRRGG